MLVHTWPQRYVADTGRLRSQTPVIGATENGGLLDLLVGQNTASSSPEGQPFLL